MSSMNNAIFGVSDKSKMTIIPNLHTLSPSITSFHTQFVNSQPLLESSDNALVKQFMYRHHPHQQPHLRFILIGDCEVGKTALLNSILPLHHPGVLTGPHFRSKTLPLCTKNITVQLWDTEEEERFNASPNYYFEKVDGVFLVYDITRRASFDRVANFWRAEVEQQAGMGIQMALIGNKCDLHDSREVSKQQAATFAEEHGMMFLETSAALPGENLTELLTLLSEKVIVQMEDSEGKLQKMNKITLKTSAMKGRHTKPSCF